MAKMEAKSATSFRLSPEAKQLLCRLSEYMGISQASVIEQAVRALARREGFPIGSGDVTSPPGEERPIWEELLEIGRHAAAADPAPLPADLAAQHDHYAYGTPKR